MPARLYNYAPFHFLSRMLIIVLLVLSAAAAMAQPAEARPSAQATIVYVDSNITTSTLWTSNHIYYIRRTDFTIAASATLTIQPGTIVKFHAPYTLPDQRFRMIVIGALSISPSPAAPVIFTSGRDDATGGDTNSDGIQTTPLPADWEGLIIQTTPSGVVNTNQISNITVRYARYGLQIKNTFTTAIAPELRGNLLVNNFCGITLTVDNNGGINSLVTNNTFQENEFGFCTTQVAQGDTGIMRPQITANTFERNRQLPFYLMGTAYPTYATNTIHGYDPTNQNVRERHLGIGLGGNIHSNGSWPLVNGDNNLPMPYVVVSPLEIVLGVQVDIQVGTIFKFYTRAEMPVDVSLGPITNLATNQLPSLTINGRLGLPDPGSPTQPVIFTSFHDDTVSGDTNGDGPNFPAAPGDWFQVAIRDNGNASTNTNFQNLEFRYGFNGLFYETLSGTSGNARSPIFDHVTFKGNVNGLRFKSYTNTGGTAPVTRITPLITNCIFENNGRIPPQSTLTNDSYRVEHGVPIYLENNVHLEQQFNTRGNLLRDNLHPAIGVAGAWRMSTTWLPIAGDGMTHMPYLVHGTLNVGNPGISNAGGKDDGVTLTLPAGTVVKFNVYTYYRNYLSNIIAAGTLELQSQAGIGEPVVFTSIYDDYRHDTSGDPVEPTRADWLSVESRHPNSRFDNIIVRWAKEGLQLHNTGTYLINHGVTNAEFRENTIGLWMKVDSSGDIDGLVSNSVFTHNNFGFQTTASTTSTGISNPTLSQNTFEYHSELPIYLNGSASPEYTNNIFRNNTHRAIGLGGYFGSDDDPITLPRVPGDTNAPFNGKMLPYAVWANTTFDWDTATTLQSGLVVKFKDGLWVKFFGALNMPTTAQARNYFTSYLDDYYDDTDAVPQPATIARNKWRGIYLYNPNTVSFSYSTISYAAEGLVIFQDRTNQGVLSWGNLNPDLIDNTYTQNARGLSLWIESAYDIVPRVRDSDFINNDYGLYTYTDPAVVNHYGTSNPQLTNNVFNGHKEFPIYLNGTADPTYTGNTFLNNTHPAIALGGVWSTDDYDPTGNVPTATWSRVPGDGGRVFPYVVLENVTLELTFTSPNLIYTRIAIPGGSLIKVSDNRNIYAWGKLLFNSTPGNEITFTSYRDDAMYLGLGGDTNANGTSGPPLRNSWKSVWLIDIPGKYHQVHDARSKYAVDGFTIFYSGNDPAAHIITSITRSVMQECVSGLAIVVGWWRENNITYGGLGSIHAALTDMTVENSDYGMITVAHNLSTGIAKPTLTGVTFRNITFYPVFLGGTSEPIFDFNNSIVNDAEFAESMLLQGEAGTSPAEVNTMDLQGFDLPGNAAGQFVPAIPDEASQLSQGQLLSGINMAVMTPQEFYPGIAIGGSWNNTVELPFIDEHPNQIPYAVVGNFPVEFEVYSVKYKPGNDVIIGEVVPTGQDFVTLGVRPGTIFKFAPGRKMTVRALADLSLQSGTATPVIFTSIRDDSAGGDTNRDSANTRPARGDWSGLTISSLKAMETDPQDVYGFVFHDAIVRYATEGLHLYHDDINESQIAVEVKDSTFVNNITGLTLTAWRTGNVNAFIHDNHFSNNGSHITGQPATIYYPGRLIVKAHQNNLLGNTSQVGIQNLNVSEQSLQCQPPNWVCDFDATDNYWGASSGPYNPSYNASGQGSSVSNYVKFLPFQNAGLPNTTAHTIRGRVTRQEFPYDPIQGAHIVLVGTEEQTVSDVNGYYAFENVPAGSYSLIAYLSNYGFEPQQIFVNLLSDASGLNFEGYFSANTGKRTISLTPSYHILRPLGSTRTFSLVVRLDAPNNTASNILVHYTTLDGTATAATVPPLTGQDYTSVKGDLTFRIGEQVKTINIPILAGSMGQDEEYFTVELSLLANSGSVQIENGVTTITIMDPIPLYLPLVLR